MLRVYRVARRGRTLMGLFCAGLLLGAVARAAQAQPHQNAAPLAEAQPHQTPPASAKPRTTLSKFEARRFRHACQERANERAFKGAEREAFLTRCFFGRVAQRGLRRECAKQGTAKGLEKTALHEFVRECVKEQRAHQKQGE